MTDFYEDDEPVEKVRAAYTAGQHDTTRPPAGYNATLTIPADFNAVVADGLIRGRLPNGLVVNVGDVVTVIDADDDAEGLATVGRVNRAIGLVYLRVHWDTIRDIGVSRSRATPAHG